MRTTFSLLILLPCLLALPGAERPVPNGAWQPLAPAAVDAGLRLLPNLGQWADEVQFAGTGIGTHTWLHRDGWTFRLARSHSEALAAGPVETSGVVVRMAFEGAMARELVGLEPLPARHHFLRGRDSQGWVRDVPAYGGVRYSELYPGIDAVVRPSPQTAPGVFEYDLHLSRGADLEAVSVRCDGVHHLSLRPDGALELQLRGPAGEAWSMVQQPPVSWRVEVDGRKTPVDSAFVLLGRDRFGFVADDWSDAESLVIDPGLSWSSLLGGGAGDVSNTVRWVEGDGVFIGGWAGSMDFPVTVGAYQTSGQRDAFVAKFSEDGTQLRYSTYLGGRDGEEVRGLDVDPSGAVTVVGYTGSDDFPTTVAAMQRTFGGASLLLATGDAFVSRLSSDGSSLLSSTYVGGFFDEVAEDVAVDAAGVATVVGWTMSHNFPVTPGGFQQLLGSALPDGFVTRVAVDGSAVFSTYLGGNSHDELHAVTIDGNGVITVTGQSDSSDYPTTLNAFRGAPQGAQDAIVTRMAADGRSLVWSTYLGGAEPDRAESHRVRADGSVVVVGGTESTGFTTTPNALQPALAGQLDGFVAVLDGSGTSLLYGSFFGGPQDDMIRGVDTDSNGDVVFVGDTAGGITVSANAPQTTYGGGPFDAFLARLDSTGSTLMLSTYLGGVGFDLFSEVDFSDVGLAVAAGRTFSGDWPVTTGVVQSVLGGTMDACVAQIDTVTVLGGYASFAPGPGFGDDSFAPGESFVALAMDITNETPRQLLLKGVTVLLAGAGDNIRDLRVARVFDDADGDGLVGPGDPLIAGPTPVVEDDAFLALSGVPMIIEPGSVAHCLVQLEPLSVCVPGAEFAASIVDLSAWDIEAVGPGGGPQVTRRGSSFVQGAVWTCGAPADLPGDQDGDGDLDAADLRQLARRLGDAPTGPDPDGDGVVTDDDLTAVITRILDRPIVLDAPSVLQVGGNLIVAGYGLQGSVTATLGGRVLTRLSIANRQLIFRVDPSAPTGSQSLVVTVGTRRVLETTVTVQ